VTRDVSWPLYAEQDAMTELDAGGVVSTKVYDDANPWAPRGNGQISQINNVSDLMFRTWSVTGMSDGKTLPATIRIDYSENGGQAWRTAQVPTTNNNQDFLFPGTDIRLTGRCDALTNLCAFRVTGTLTIEAKPWGSAKRPDCTGFTGGQLSAMDFGKMDLSEWLAEVMDTAADATPAELAGAAAQQFQDFNSFFQEGK